MNVSYGFDTREVDNKGDIQRQCTWQKTGTMDVNAEKFTGTITKTNCVLTLYEYEPGNILEHVLRKAHANDQ